MTITKKKKEKYIVNIIFHKKKDAIMVTSFFSYT